MSSTKELCLEREKSSLKETMFLDDIDYDLLDLGQPDEG